MRITSEEKIATRARILEVAKRLFQRDGFHQATIRELAKEANLAAGTLFNYFDSKEEIALALMQAALCKADERYQEKRRRNASLGEDLFLRIATQLRALKPLQRFIQPAIELALSPAGVGDGSELAQQVRANELEAVTVVLRTHGIDVDQRSMAAPIYWALYVGVLLFWAKDKSAKQEDTLAMLDQAVNMFVTWLESAA